MPKHVHNKTARQPKTEPFHQWLRFHEAFNRTIKTAFAALHLTKEYLTRSGNASNALARIIAKTGEPWGNKNHYDVTVELTTASQVLCEAGIVRVWSAFDNFITMVEADLNSWDAHQGNQSTRYLCEEKAKSTNDNSLNKIYSRYALNDKTSTDLILVQEYFQLLRNCICHRSGEASPALIKCALELKDTDIWKNVKVSPRKRDNPDLPRVVDNRILLLPRHAVFFSAVCHCLAKQINESLVKVLGNDGFVFRAAPLSLELFSGTKAPKTAEGIINTYFHQRSFYVFKDTEVVKVLRSLGIWDNYRKGYETIVRTLSKMSSK